jgi:hypothetical protein
MPSFSELIKKDGIQCQFDHLSIGMVYALLDSVPKTKHKHWHGGIMKAKVIIATLGVATAGALQMRTM